MKTSGWETRRLRGRWRDKAALISLYALLVSLGLHLLLTLGFKIKVRPEGSWPVARPLILIVGPREPGSSVAPVGRTRTAVRRFGSAAPRFVSDVRSALDAMARLPVAPVPLLLLSASADSREDATAAEPLQRQWRWHIECEGDVPSAVARSFEKLGHTPLEDARAAPRPAVFSCIIAEPGSFRSFVIEKSSGDTAFDEMARDTLRTTPIEHSATTGPRMAAPRSHVRFRVAIAIEASP